MRNRPEILAVVFAFFFIANAFSQAGSVASPDPAGAQTQTSPATQSAGVAGGSAQASALPADSASTRTQAVRKDAAPVPTRQAESSEEGSHAGVKKAVIIGAVVLAVVALAVLVGSGSGSGGGGY